METRRLLERSLCELYHAMDHLPEQETLDRILERLGSVGQTFDFIEDRADPASDLEDFYETVHAQYTKDDPEERSLGRVLHEKGLDAYQSYRLYLAEVHAYSSRDARRRVRDAIGTILDEDVRCETL